MSSVLSTSRLALGTAQFGLNYGIANQLGQIFIDDAATILECAAAAGLDTLDTAIAYGDRGAGANIPGGSALIFEMELLGIKPAATTAPATPK